MNNYKGCRFTEIGRRVASVRERDRETAELARQLHTGRRIAAAERLYYMSAYGQSYGPDPTNIPKEDNAMNQQTINGLKAALVQAEKDFAARLVAEEREKRLKRYIELGIATNQLLTEINAGYGQGNERFATFRQELSPLAAEFGYSIVLVGDKTQASLVQL